MTRFVGTPLRGIEFATPSDEAISARVVNDAHPRLRIDAGGRLTWSGGSTAGDVTLYRDAANVLKSDDLLQALGGVATITTNGVPTDSSPDGTIAVDTTNDTFYFRSSGEWLEVSSGANVVIASTEPVDAESGDLWFDSDTLVLYILNGATWVSVSGSLTLAELDDVSIPSPQAGDVLAYNGTNWVASLGNNPKYAVAEVVGDGIETEFTITHNFGTRDVLVIARNNASPYEQIEVAWESTDVNTVDILFSTPPAVDGARINVLYTGATTINSTYSTTIGDGVALSYVITHDLDTRDISIVCRESASPYGVVDVAWEATSVNTATLYFSDAPAVNEIRVTVYSSEVQFSRVGARELDELDDVVIASPTAGEVVRYDGTEWRNDHIILNDISNVNVTSVTSGDFLKWNGSAWVNQSGVATESYVNTAVSNLVDSAPLALDTLNELAAALNDDASFSTTVTNALAGKAPLASPALTGVPTAPTPTLGTDTTQIATTEFVQDAIGSFATNLDGLSDVVITSPEEFQTLEYNGTNWVNKHASVVSYVRNAETTTLTTGTVVYLFGATGDHATVKRADKSSDTTSSKTIGLVGANIPASENGPVITRGYVDGINLSAYSPGQVLWLGENGTFTTTKATAPDHLVFVGVVVRATNNGIVYVATQNGYELDELHNVSLPSPSSGQYLKYDGSLWVADTIDLGTDTTGSYVSSLVAGTGISLANNSGEGATPTVSLNASINDLNDVNTAGIGLNSLLIYKSPGEEAPPYWQPINADTFIGGYSLDQLSDTETGVQQEGAIIAFDSTTSKWTSVIQDSALANNQVLVWDSVSTKWVAREIALGTYTTGNYVSDVSAGTGVSVSHTPGEGSTPTISIGQAVATSSSPTFAGLTINGASVVFEGATANDYETTLTVTDPTADRTITFPNASGTVALSGSIALGTDTTGNYMSGISAGTGVNVSHTPGEGSTATISIGQAVDTVAVVQFYSVQTIGDITVGGNLTVNGTTTTLNTTTLQVEDNIVTLNYGALMPSNNAGIEVSRGIASFTPAIRWNEMNDKWEFTNDGTNYTALGGNVMSSSSNAAIITMDI